LIASLRDPYRVTVLAQMEATDYGQVLLGAITEMLQEATVSFWASPRIDNDNLLQDFRTKMGTMSALRDVLDLPTKARALLNGAMTRKEDKKQE